MPHLCLRCLERDEPVERLGTMDEYNIQGPYCDDCWSDLSEAAHERWLEDYYGGSGPVTIQEQYDAAAKVKRESR